MRFHFTPFQLGTSLFTIWAGVPTMTTLGSVKLLFTVAFAPMLILSLVLREEQLSDFGL